MAQPLNGYFLGRRAYEPTLKLMEQLFEARRNDTIKDTVLLLEHEPVITLGRGAHPENLLASPEQLAQLGVSVVSTGRGGDVTLHAPGQLIAYPLIKLSPDRQDVRKYVKALTEVMRRLVSEFGVDGGTIDKLIGLWIDQASPEKWNGEENATRPAKIGAIGVRISRWVTSHGFALNLTTDLSLYSLIVPCGISEYPVASVASLTGKSPTVPEQAARALSHFSELLGEGEPTYEDCSCFTLEQVRELIYSSSGSEGATASRLAK